MVLGVGPTDVRELYELLPIAVVAEIKTAATISSSRSGLIAVDFQLDRVAGLADQLFYV